jgi:Tfp pilus assembly protein PilX
MKPNNKKHMIKMAELPNQTRHQQGATLVISMIFMLLISIAATSVTKFAQVNYKMADIFIEQQASVEDAESGLVAAVAKLESMSFDIGCDRNDSECFVSEFDYESCNDGLCFVEGTYTASTAYGNCTNAENSTPLYQNTSVWENNAKTVSRDNGKTVKYIIEFRCYSMSSNANTADIAKTEAFDTSSWNLTFRISALAHDTASGSRTLLQKNYKILGAGVIGIKSMFSINGSLTNMSGTDVSTYYCTHCSKADIEADPEAPDIILNPNEIPSVSYDTYVDAGWNGSGTANLNGYAATDRWEDPSYPDSSVTIPKLDDDAYFASYFGTKDREEFYTDHSAKKVTGSELLAMTAAEFTGTPLNPQVIVITGNLDVSSAVDLRHIGNENTIIIVQGNSTVTANFSHKFGFLYIAGNMSWNGSNDVAGVIAVEGNAYVQTSLGLRPQSNPNDLFDALNIEGPIEWGFSSWNQPSINF